MTDINYIKLPQYCSKPKFILFVNNNAICIVRGKKSLQDIIRYCCNEDVKLKDGRIKKLIDKAVR